MEKLSINGAYVFTPRQLPDSRGIFLEWFRRDEFAGDLGHRLDLGQANCSVSRRGVVRGIHFADVPPGQAKYVTCMRGAITDVIVDIRVGSPTYRQHEIVRLDETERRAVYVGEGLGHAFVALTDDATVVYLCSTGHTPEREHSVNPLDPDLAIPWPRDIELIVSERDRAAPPIVEAERTGLLPQYSDCLAYVDKLGHEW
jgi:dTDP-4-dehydrorhamnose 3,5-epimerase